MQHHVHDLAPHVADRIGAVERGVRADDDVLVLPGDIIVADDDGAVVVPAQMAEALLANASTHHEWEEFSRIRLSEGGDLRRYYPLSDAARPEYEAWVAVQKAGA
jgi:regulator of RNase E activity RraA